MGLALPRTCWVLSLMAAMVLFAHPASAQDDQPDNAEPTVTIADFAGTWHGMGILETEDSLFFAMNRRDLDVTISGDNRDFTIRWTTITRTGDNPDDPVFRRDSASLEFSPADHPHVYEASSTDNPLDGGVMSWARLHGQTLSVYRMYITEEGGYSISSYDRTLTDGEMQLRFVRLEDGQPVREVNGQLTRVEP